ncbi:BPSS1780 family membrane protein [Paraburkholderia sp. BL21I4N1]|uniref:BPSS1780 family membrane protein n=1 Tax=Paraburkholderia sp. BL21I4N1 TaxID=1938801 RepID=UPI000D4042D6|nr:BPSS1780 family membrane protein [Paraburkholderia sp. BL21I4N1]PQV54633.1 hypothetical protein B0G83_101816 [Paraburkholderia sp. BL21I4N1]
MKMHYLHDSAVPNGARNTQDSRVPNARAIGMASFAGWLEEGVRIARVRPVLWLAAVLACADVSTLLGLVPSLLMLAMLVAPIAIAAVVLMQERSGNDARWSVSEMVDAVHAHRNALLTIGACCVAATYIGQLILFAAFHVSVKASVAANGVHALTFAYATYHGADNALEPLFNVLIHVVPVALLWFAPALVVLNNASPANAITASVRAVVRNWPIACLGVVAIVAGALLVPFVPMLVCALIVTPLTTALIVMSLYGSYRGVFGER